MKHTITKSVLLISGAMLASILGYSQQPSNDYCGNAIPLVSSTSDNYSSGITLGATQSMPASTCDSYTGNSDDDVWYKFVALSTKHTIKVQSGANFDAVLDVKEATCSATTIACADASGAGQLETKELNGLIVGNTYAIRVYHYGSGAGSGNFQICVTSPAAVNDYCANAIGLTVGSSCVTTSGTTFGATNSMPAVSCGGYTGVADDDVWYNFIAPASGNIVITVTPSASFDAVVDLRSGACMGTTIACQDGINGGGEIETLAYSGLTASATYYIRVYDYGTGSSSASTFDICVYNSTPPPANDDCVNAITLPSGTNCNYTSGTTANATLSIPAIACTSTGTADDDVWYQFTAVTTNHTVKIQSGMGFDAVVDVRSGSCTGTNIGCADVTGSGGFETVNLTGLTAGTNYLIRVYSWSNTSTGTFDICITHTVPVNDDCANAANLTSSTNCNYTPGATFAGTQSIPAITCTGTGTADDDVWYAFTAVAPTHTVSVQCGTGFDGVVDVRSGSCTGTNIGCSDLVGTGNLETVNLSGLTIGSAYLVRVYSFGSSASSTGTFDICVTHTAPVNNNCANAINLTSATTCNYTSGTTVGASQSIAAILCNSTTGTADDDVWYTFTAAAATHSVSVQGATGFDAVVDVREINCSGTNVGCADATSSGGLETVGLSGLTIGTTYYVRVYGWGSNASSQGGFQICVTHTTTSPVPPVNNDCANATSLTSATTCNYISGTTVNGTQSIPAIACNSFTGTADDDVWYTFTAVAATHTVSVQCGIGFDGVVDVRSGNCNTGTNIGCSDVVGTGNLETVGLSGLTIGTTYYVRVYSFGSIASSQGSFQVCVTHTGPIPPANDACANAVALTSATTCNYISGTTVNGTQSLPAILCNSFTGTADDDVWYTFTAVAVTHTVSVQGAAGFDAVVDVLSGGCTGTSIGCADATFGGGLETVGLSGLTIGNTYLVRVYSYFSSASSQGSFQICVTHSTPTDVASIDEQLFISLFPNPTSGILNLALPQANNSTFTFTLLDAMGKQVKQFNLVNEMGQTHSISIEELPAGLYFYTITYDNGKTAAGKIVKQ